MLDCVLIACLTASSVRRYSTAGMLPDVHATRRGVLCSCNRVMNSQWKHERNRMPSLNRRTYPVGDARVHAGLYQLPQEHEAIGQKGREMEGSGTVLITMDNITLYDYIIDLDIGRPTISNGPTHVLVYILVNLVYILVSAVYIYS